MIQNLIKFALYFIGFILIQVLFFDNMELSGYINPYFYILFILLLPIDTNLYVVLILGFLLGLCIDIFSNTLGLHIIATTFLAYLRNPILSITAPQGGYDISDKPHINSMGEAWFFYYITPLVIIHHLVLFFMETFNFSNFFQTFSKSIISALFTITIIFISQLLTYKKIKKR